MPTTWRLRRPWPSPTRTRNTVLLLRLETSIDPEKGIESRGWRLKPSSVLMTSTSAQSVGRVEQLSLGRFIRSPVLLSWSKSVKRSLGNAPVTVEARSNRASTAAAEARGVRRSRKPTARTTKRRYSGLLSGPFRDGVGTATGRVQGAFEKRGRSTTGRFCCQTLILTPGRPQAR